MKTCAKCLRAWPLTEFAKNRVKRDGLADRCKQCMAKASRKTYERYRETIKKKARAFNKARVPELRAIMEAARDVPCTDCGGRFPTCCMDFDHLDPALKRWNISDISQHGFSPDTLREEIAKCEVVCSNCHRIRTHARRASTMAATLVAPAKAANFDNAPEGVVLQRTLDL